jgi:glycosyltransferase involved in cell wall biosynthesis
LPSVVDVSFVLPCLNENESLAHVINEIISAYSNAEFSFEVIVADNGSTDGSIETAIQLGAKVVNVSKRGYGAALMGGINAALGQKIVMGDADGSYSFHEAKQMLTLLDSRCDLVVGNRFKGGIETGAMPFLHRYLGNPVLSFLGRKLFKLKVRDFHCGIRAFNRDAIIKMNLRSTGMEFASEMLVLAGRKKMVIKEIPVTLKRDLRTRPPHLRTWVDGWRHLRFIFAYSPSWTFLIPASVLAISSLFIGYQSVNGPIEIGNVELSNKSAIVAMSIGIVAVNSIWSFVLARAVISESSNSKAMRTELLAAFSILTVVIGIALIGRLFQTWQEANFARFSASSGILSAVLGASLIAVGGTSFFAVLLLGIIKSRK